MTILHGIRKSLKNSLVIPGLERWTPELFEAFCLANPGLDCELDPEGNIVILSPSSADADGKNTDILTDLNVWAWESGAWKVFGPSAGFTFANGAVRSPDATVVRLEDWEALPLAERSRFAEITPMFVMELRSSDTDSLPELQMKMEEYLACGVALGWLVDPVESRLHVYRPGREPEVLDRPATSPESPELPGFILDFARIW